MPYKMFDYSNTNADHRKPLLRALERVNKITPQFSDILLVVSTRNMIKILPKIFISNKKLVLNIVGFGRLYTDYGIMGRSIFMFVVWLHDRVSTEAFIVEHEDDQKHLKKFVKKPIFVTHGSGLDVSGFQCNKQKCVEKYRIGYMSRFHKSKGSHEVLKIAKNLPTNTVLTIAGWDITGNSYENEFRELAELNENIVFLGALLSRREVSNFFNNIDLFLSPSAREGGNIALQEAIWHEIPFITTDVPGCRVLAHKFDCSAVKMNMFCDTVLETATKQMKVRVVGWRQKIRPFLADQVEQEFFKHLHAIAKTKKL